MNRTDFSSLRKVMVCAAALSILLPLGAQTNETKSVPPPAPRRPNIVLILADTIGYGDLGCYGQAKIKTPNLDKLASEGVRFTSFYAGSPDDTAARAALMTGMEPRHLHSGFNQALPDDALTLAAFLKQQGYHAGLIGAWNLGDTGSATPDKKGFDEFAGFLNPTHARDYFTDRIWRHAPKTDYDAGFDGQMVFNENHGGKRGQFMPDAMTTWAMNFINNNKPDLLNHYRPFFLCVSFPIPHVSASAAPPGDSQYGDAPWPPLERIRATLISRMDENIGRLVNKLDDSKIGDNTVIIFTSVNGPQNENGVAPEFFGSSGPLRGWQGSMNEGGLRVPLIIHWPVQTKAGRTSDLICAAWDIFPTAAEIGFAKPPEKLDGISLLPTLAGQHQKNEHKFLYWESSENGFKQAARMDEWKLIRTNTAAAFELYNLQKDPGEKQNLAEKNSGEVRKIEKALGLAK